MAVDYKNSDRKIYETELRDFLPGNIFDAHVHLFDKSGLPRGFKHPGKSLYRKFGCSSTIENFLDYAGKLLPDQELHFNSFGNPTRGSDLDCMAKYTGRISDNRKSFGMTLISPYDDMSLVKTRIVSNRLVGYKPYLDFVDAKDKDEITIFDMLSEAQMEYANDNGLAITLHIPRPGRLADTLNQKQMVKICRMYPDTTIIFAHIGRAYYLRNVIGYLDGIAKCPNAYVDTSMVNHEGVLEYAFRKFPVERILFGSDAPVAFLRGKSVEINNQYAYLMGEDYEIGTAMYDAKHAVQFTSFYYEQLRGIKLAASRAKLSRSTVEKIFFKNASSLFSKIAKKLKYI